MAEPNIASAPPQLTAESKSILLVVERPEPNQVITTSAILVQGFAVATAEIQEIIVECADIVQSANFGLRRDDLAKAYPTYPPLANSGFTCEIKRDRLVNLSAQAANEGLPINVIARDRKGREQKFQSRLMLKPEPDKLHEPPKPTRVDSDDDPTMVLHIDERSVDKRGLLQVKGWALSHSAIDAVNVYVGSELVGSAELALDRPDVAVAWPKFTSAGKSGFLLVTDGTRFFPDGQQSSPTQIKIVGQAAGGVIREAEFPLEAPIYIARRKPKEIHEFFCDQIKLTSRGSLSLGGWAVSSVGIAKISIIFEGEVLGLADYGQDRADVGNKYPSIAQSRKSGFDFRASIDPAKVKGEHVVCMESVLLDGSTRQNRVAVVATNTAEPEAVIAQGVAEEVQLYIDEPQIVDGKATRLIEGTLAINGWTIAKSGVASVDFELDGLNIGTAYYGVRREDVAKAFPAYGWDNALLSGFAFSLPHRFLTEGQHQVTVKIKTKANEERIRTFEIDVGEVGEQPGPWSLRERVSAAELLFANQVIDRFKFRPTFYICVNCRCDQVDALPATLRCVAAQSYPDWTIVVSSDAKAASAIEGILRDQFSAIGPRAICQPHGADIEKLNAQARPRDLVLPLDAGDVLAADALFEFAVMLNRNEQIDFIYADERRHNIGTSREDAFFKPDWSPTLLMSSNYIGRPWCATFAQFQKAERQPFRSQMANFDAVLELTETASEVAHVPRVLARRGEGNIETPEMEMRALKGALKRRRLAWVVEDGVIANTYRCRPKAKVEGLVSIVIPTCAARGLIKVCLDSLRNISTYKNIEIICVENIADDDSEWKPWLRDNCDVVVEIREKFNWSLFNNVAAREASGEYLLFLNDDIEVIQPDWLEAMLDQARDDNVGIVGPQLLYPDHKVQHAGMFLAGGSLARHAFRFCAEDDPGYFGLALTQRDVMAVTGACMLIKTETFKDLGCFDESHSVINNDLDFCLKIHERKLRCVYTPFARLIHHELASRKDLKDDHDASGFNARWTSLTSRGDPFFHPALDKDNDIVQADPEPSELLFAGFPLFKKQAVKRILAIKVDHIGDFITAFPAFRRIKEHFPDAELTALVAPASKQLAKLEPSIDRVVPFEFFHARSQLGRTDLPKERLDELQRELSCYDFDIAIDMRKQSDTRNLLKTTGARLTAGFDHRNEFGWLDVALNFEGDLALTQKRQHVSADLINLIDTVANAGMQDRSLIKRGADWSARQLPIVSRLAEQGLYKKHVVCIHPAAGNETKQWPVSYFADLMNALLVTEDVHFSIIGGPDDAEIANGIIELVSDSNRVFNLVGKLKLNELSYFLDTCTLFVGNDSGPKHLAAGIGVPTIGIQSGIVDAREWGPQGDVAVTAKRNMSCSPCYHASKDLCHRGLACLSGLQPAAIVSMARNLLKLERGIQIT
jgi:ADP-heptose:LPS heptosyltransferase/GT2 family glycosyltransferase